MCVFVTKNEQFLKVHKKAKHIQMKFHCVLCVLKTNNKIFGFGESFEPEEDYKQHIKKFRARAKMYQCEVYDFETNIKNFFSDHKSSKCLK